MQMEMLYTITNNSSPLPLKFIGAQLLSSKLQIVLDTVNFIKPVTPANTVKH